MESRRRQEKRDMESEERLGIKGERYERNREVRGIREKERK